MVKLPHAGSCCFSKHGFSQSPVADPKSTMCAHQLCAGLQPPSTLVISIINSHKP